MAKKIRFPLDMGNGVEVRTLEELQANFSIEKILGYYADGKLVTWLRDRYLDDIEDKICGLNKDNSDFAKQICDAFGVEYNEEVNMEDVKERNRKLTLLKQYTEEKEFFDVVDDIAFNQDDLYDLLDEDKHTIYLCGDKFSVPLGKKGAHYIGINSPEVVISSKEKVDFEEKEIRFENVRFDKQYQSVVDENNYSATEKMYVAGKVLEAFNIFKNAAENNNARAMYYLGECYFHGLWGITADINLAKQWRKRGYEGGDILASVNYAYMLDDEEDEIRIIKDSVMDLENLSKNNLLAKYELAFLYLDSKYIDKDYDKAIKLLIECAETGFWRAMHILGLYYFNGEYVDADYEKTVFWFKQSAKIGYDCSQYNLATCYDNGWGVEKDHKKAVEWYRKAARQGHKNAQNELLELGESWW